MSTELQATLERIDAAVARAERAAAYAREAAEGAQLRAGMLRCPTCGHPDRLGWWRRLRARRAGQPTAREHPNS